MKRFNPAKLQVKFLPPATAFEPVEGRKYTLTHSDLSSELFLSIGFIFDSSTINSKVRDEVLAEWVPRNGEYMLLGRVYVNGGEFDEKYSKIRYLIFKRELNLALTAMMYGDQAFFTYYPWLLDAPIYIRFESSFPEYEETLYCGTPRQYIKNALSEQKV